MRRIEQDPEEVRQEEEAMARAATPTHEQPTEEFDSRELLTRLGQYGLAEFGVPFGKRKVKLKDPPELGWTIEEEPKE